MELQMTKLEKTAEGINLKTYVARFTSCFHLEK